MQIGLTSSRNPDRHRPLWHEVIGALSWGGLSFIAILFVRVDNPGQVFLAWVVAIFLATWIVTALAARNVRRLPVRHRGQRRVPGR